MPSTRSPHASPYTVEDQNTLFSALLRAIGAVESRTTLKRTLVRLLFQIESASSATAFHDVAPSRSVPLVGPSWSCMAIWPLGQRWPDRLKARTGFGAAMSAARPQR